MVRSVFNWLLEICQADLSIAVSIHSRPPCARIFLVFCCFPCTHYTTNGPLCLAPQGLFDCSVNIKYKKKTDSFQTCTGETITISRAENEEKNARLASQNERISCLESQVELLTEALMTNCIGNCAKERHAMRMKHPTGSSRARKGKEPFRFTGIGILQSAA